MKEASILCIFCFAVLCLCVVYMCSCVFLQRHKRVYSCPHTHTTDAAFKSLPVKCILRGSNPRGLSPLGLKSSALTTRPRMRVTCTRRGFCSTQMVLESLSKKVCVAPRVRLELTTYRLTAGRATDCAIQELMWVFQPTCKNSCTACGDRTRDQSIKSRTLYLTELRRPVI